MSGFLGMVPEDVEGLAAELEERAGQVETVIQAVASRLQETTWRGTDREAFETHWSGDVTNALHQVAEVLRQTGRAAQTHAAQQRQASS